MRFSLKRTTYDDADLRGLIRLLDKELRVTNGDEAQDMLDQYNIVHDNYKAVVAYTGDTPAGCGCFKEFDANTIEIKRMFVHPEYRGMGMARAILGELEKWGYELNYINAVLETGTRLHDAVQLYNKTGYTVRAQYGQYIGVENSVCMEKALA